MTGRYRKVFKERLIIVPGQDLPRQKNKFRYFMNILKIGKLNGFSLLILNG
jgi:hypothetical protein